MSIVLWANMLIDGKVESDESDKYALYKHSKKLDKLSKSLGLMSFSSIQDLTDMQFNLGEEELPDGMQSTNELMAAKGVWVSAEQGVEMLEKLIAAISEKKLKFGILTDASQEIINELEESLTMAHKALEQNAKFNFSVVM